MTDGVRPGPPLASWVIAGTRKAGAATPARVPIERPATFVAPGHESAERTR